MFEKWIDEPAAGRYDKKNRPRAPEPGGRGGISSGRRTGRPRTSPAAYSGHPALEKLARGTPGGRAGVLSLKAADRSRRWNSSTQRGIAILSRAWRRGRTPTLPRRCWTCAAGIPMCGWRPPCPVPPRRTGGGRRIGRVTAPFWSSVIWRHWCSSTTTDSVCTGATAIWWSGPRRWWQCTTAWAAAPFTPSATLWTAAWT